MTHMDPRRRRFATERALPANRRSDESDKSLALNFMALVLLAVGFFLHNWPGS